MYSYTIMQWLFFFYFYCFFGWCFESTVVSVKKKKLVNRGFMRGPFLPIYGSGAIMMLLVSMPFQDNLVMVYIAGCLGATVLEYVTGVAMEALFKVRYWDYSNQRFQYQGHICLSSTVAWGFLTILMTEIVHKPIEKLVLAISGQWLTPFTLVLTAIICGDFALSFKAALDLRDILVKMEKAKEDLVHIQRRLDVVIALANEELSCRKEAWNEKSENLELRIVDLKEGIEDKLEHIREILVDKSAEYSENLREEVREILFKYRRSTEERDSLSRIKDFFQKGLIRSNPTMKSLHFPEALEEIKQSLNKIDKKESEQNKKP